MPTQIYKDQTFNTWTPGTDSYALILGTQEPQSLISNCIIDANGAEWGLKMPGNIGSTIENTKLIGGKERALDMVQGSGGRFNNCIFSAGKDRSPISSKWSFSKTCDIGIKGGYTDARFNGCVMTDLLLGDHSIYDNPNGIGPKTTEIVLDACKSPSGAPIIIRAYNADLPQLVNGTQAIAIKWCGLVVSVYFWIAGKWIDSRMPPA